MKGIGMVRNVDKFGRIMIPKEIRHRLGIKEGSLLEFFVDEDDAILLKKYTVKPQLIETLKKLNALIDDSCMGFDAITINQIRKHIVEIEHLIKAYNQKFN